MRFFIILFSIHLNNFQQNKTIEESLESEILF